MDLIPYRSAHLNLTPGAGAEKEGSAGFRVTRVTGRILPPRLYPPPPPTFSTLFRGMGGNLGAAPGLLLKKPQTKVRAKVHLVDERRHEYLLGRGPAQQRPLQDQQS